MNRYDVLGDVFFFDPVSTGFSLEDINLKWTQDEISGFHRAFYENEKHITAYSFCLNISDACNLSCSYCFNTNKSGSRMDAESAIKILEDLFRKYPDGEKYYVDMSGVGEPLLALKTVLAVADWCKKKQNEIRKEILPQFVCNGTLLKPYIAEILQKRGILFGVSLDGNRSTHDSQRKDLNGNPTYDLIIENVKGIKNREYVGCAATLTDNVFPLLDTLIELSKVFKTISFRPARGTFGNAVEEWMLEYDILAQRLLNDASNDDDALFKTLMNGEDYFGRFLNRAFGGIRVIRRCDAGVSKFYASLDGKIYPCPAASLENGCIIKARSLEETDNQCHFCEFGLLCGGECEIILNNSNNVPNKQVCEFRKHLILLSNFLERKINAKYPFFHQKIVDFVIEKSKRNQEDRELRKFLNSHQELNFTDAKMMFDNTIKRY